MVDRKMLEAHKELVAHAYSQAQAYTNLIMVAGYAGYFTLWGFIRDYLTRATEFWSALLLSVSLSGFVLWEVYCMYCRSQSLLSLSRPIKKPEHFKELLEKHESDERERDITLGRLWIFQLFFVAGTGFAAVIIMISALVHCIWRLYVLP